MYIISTKLNIVCCTLYSSVFCVLCVFSYGLSCVSTQRITYFMSRRDLRLLIITTLHYPILHFLKLIQSRWHNQYRINEKYICHDHLSLLIHDLSKKPEFHIKIRTFQVELFTFEVSTFEFWYTEWWSVCLTFVKIPN